MKIKILEFIGLLRKAGLNITPAEIIDTLKAISLLSFQKDYFYIALQATLVKEMKDISVFDKIFNLYFNQSFTIPNQNENHNFLLGQYKNTSISDGRGLVSTGAGGSTPDLLEAVLNKENKIILDYFQNLINENYQELLGINTLHNIDDIIRQTQIKLEWFMVLNKLDKMFEQDKISITDYYEALANLEFLKKELKTMIETNNIEKFGVSALKKIAEQENIYKTNFIDLKPNQIEELERKIIHLGKKLATKKSHRYKKANRGKVYIKKVVRESLPYGGIPIKLDYLNRKMTKPSLIMLCDISGSVAQFSRFMLQLIFLSQKLFRDVSLYVFIDHLVEVTGLFKNYDIQEVLAELPYLTKVTETGYSHFGNTFKEFCQEYLHTVNEKTTVIILGDGKNNWRPSGIEYLSMIREKCYRLFWLNPQPFEEWNKRDSIIGEYEKYCNGVFECRNMEQLEMVVKKLF